MILTFKFALSAAAAADFCLGIICRQCDRTTKVLGKILSSPFLLLPGQLMKGNLKKNTTEYILIMEFQTEKQWPN